MSNYFNHNENEILLLSRVREGDVKAFEMVYNMYSSRLYGNILKLVKSPLIAEELLQDIFQRVWEHRKNIDTGKSFKSYLFTIAKNLVCDYFNKASRQRLIDRYIHEQEERQITGEERRLEEKEYELILQNAIKQLPPQRKLVYTLCKLDGKSYEEVSKTLGISASTISDHIVKATKSIKAYYLSKDLLYIFIIIASQL